MHSDGLKCAGEARLVFKFQCVFCSKGDRFCGCCLEVWMNLAAKRCISVDDLLMAAESSPGSAFI